MLGGGAWGAGLEVFANAPVSTSAWAVSGKNTGTRPEQLMGYVICAS
jgi:hypothetical protein